MYIVAGTYTATLIVTDAAGGTAQATAAVVVSPALAVGASADVSRGPAPQSVSFSGAGSGGLPPFTYRWNFGDGLSSTNQNPTHTYAVAGTFTANFSVTDGNGVLVNASPLTIVVTPALSISSSVLPSSEATYR